MAEGRLPEQESIDEIREEARREALWALRELEKLLLLDDGMGGMDAIRIGALCQRVIEKMRIYRMAVNIGHEPTHRAKLAEAESYCRHGLGRRGCEL